MKSKSKKRIVFIDLMRALAVIMMIQGHTTDTFLSDEYRNTESVAYNFWLTMRGFTAPIFMFSSGLIFTYLLKPDNYDFFSNPRIIKGIKRGFTLIAIGYLLRFPTHRIFDIASVSKTQWDIFLTVDALHLIGIGLLSIVAILFISKNLKLNFQFAIGFSILISFIVSPYIAKINWDNYLPQILSGYFFEKNGSLFPIFPWIIYVLAGAMLGNYLSKNEGIYFKKRFSIFLFTIGSSLVGFYLVIYAFSHLLPENISDWLYANSLIIARLGYVIIANSLMAFTARNFNHIPKMISDTGKKTLMLYVAHVIILYGCALFPGFNKFWGKTLTSYQTIIVAIVMLGLMLLLVLYSDRISNYWKNKLMFKKAKAV
ncbi:MAG: heparan-alpha-glucosaminide N-acetyltransferase domain-containing protein [Melioribacteraceae bacterium]